MKKILLISAILLSTYTYEANAQFSVSINIGSQPSWGPSGYNYVNYYYLPDLDVYYDVPQGMFVYFDLGRWNYGRSLPARYGHYDLYRSYKVVVNDRNPWLRNDYYHSHYASYRGRYQPVIRDNHANEYSVVRERGNSNRYDNRHDDWNKNNSRGNDHGHGRGDHGRH